MVLPAAVAGSKYYVANYGVNPLLVYPASGDTINAAGANLPVTVPAGVTQMFIVPSSSAYYTVP